MVQIVEHGNLTITGLSADEREELKKLATFKNPKYEQAKRYSRRKVVYMPKTIEYFNEYSVRNENGSRSKVIQVPIGMLNLFDLSESSDVLLRDERVTVEQVYPKFIYDLRNDQERAFKNYINNPYKNVVQLPTGKGKTILALYIAQHLQQRTLVLVHKDDLVVGWKKDINEVFGGKADVGLVKAKSDKIGKHITISTVQTLMRKSPEYMEKFTQQFGLVIVDECLKGDTLIVMEDGSVHPIINVNNGECVLGGEVSNKFNKECYIWELESSHAILKGSRTHPTWCVKKSKDGHTQYTEKDFVVKFLGDLTSDYMIPIRINIPHTQTNDTSIDLARFIALIQCDGHLDSNSRRVKVNVQKDRRFYYEVMENGCNEFCAELKYSHDVRENITYWTNDSKVRLYLEDIIPSGKKSDIIKVPFFMYSAPIDSVKAYIETCFNCEGDLSLGSSNRINFSTCSESFAQGLSLLLKKFGILCNIQHIRRSGNCHDLYRLSVCGVFFNKFMDTFKLLDRKMTTNRNKANKNKNRFVGDYYLSDVKSSTCCGYKDTVYDFTVDDESHSFVANGVYTHNCHHVGANTFNIVDIFNSKYKLGLSATPTRTDGLTHCLNLYFGGLCHRQEMDVDDEDLCNAEVIVRQGKFKFLPFVHEGLILNYWDFNKIGANDKFYSDIPYKQRPPLSFMEVDNLTVGNPRTKIQICKDIISEYRQGHNIIVFFTQKEHIRMYHSYLKMYIPAEKMQMFYGDNNEKSEVIMARAESGECTVTLATYSKATEGTNVKSWEVGIFASSLNNEKNIKQSIGRLLRKKDGKLNPVRIYDYQFSEVYSLDKHYHTRKKIYDEFKFKVTGDSIRGRQLNI